MPADAKPVNIGIVTYNRLEMTKICVEHIFKHTKYPFILTIVDNGSTDGTQEWLVNNSFAISQVIQLEKNIGVAKASNVAWRSGPDDYYIKLDNDMVVRRDGWLGELVELCDKVPQLGAVAYNVEGTQYNIRQACGMKFQLKSQGNLGGCSMMVPKKTLDRLGYWCEEYGLYGEEDADYGYRITKAGLWNVYHKDMGVLVHLPHPDFPEIKEDPNEYRDFKNKQRKDNLEAASAYHKNILKYSDNGQLKVGR